MESPASFLDQIRTVDNRIVLVHHPVIEVVGLLFADNLRHYLAQRPLLNVAARTRGY